MQKFANECEYLIHLVRCTIHDLQPRELPDGLQFERVYEWGQFHQVANMAFYSIEKLENKPESQLYRKWQECRDQAIIRDITQNYAASEVREALRKAGIRWLEVQGTKIKPLYPQPEWRTMSDIDFIIDPENIPKATEIFEALGYECKDDFDTGVDAHRPPNINIEMHTEYFREDSEYRKVMHSPFDSADGNGQCDLNTFYLYNLLHIARHYFSCGCGIRRVLDVYYLNQAYGQTVNRDWIRAALKAVNAEDFAADLSNLANAWFAEEEQVFPQNKMARYIINSGLHGHKLNAHKRSLQKAVGHTGRFPKLKYVLRRFFGTGEDLKARYPVLERHRVLYPFCWLCRVFCALKPKEFKRIRQEAKAVQELEAME